MTMSGKAEKNATVTYFLSSGENPVTREQAIWGDPLPISRTNQPETADPGVRYGDYFSAVRRFLEADGCERLLRPASICLQRTVHQEDLLEIQIILEKHGEFYHPARIKTILEDQTLQFVVNAAVSRPGQESIEREHGWLNQLGRAHVAGFLPEVYGLDTVQTGDGGVIKLFLGQWFENHSEFHQTRLPDGTVKIVVWDKAEEACYLTADQTWEMYREAARILTHYYNIETFEQVYPWHHAAGDFVIDLQQGQVDLKLVTVRGYVSPLEPEERNRKDQDLPSILEAMLVFFLNLSIRTRLDRIDGVGEIVWSDEAAVQGTVDGFFAGLLSKPQIRLTPVPLSHAFQYYVSTYNPSELFDIASDIVNAYHPLAPEVPVIRKHLEKHVSDLIFEIKSKKLPD